MDKSIRKLTAAEMVQRSEHWTAKLDRIEREAIKAQFKKATRQWQGQTAQVFANDDIRKQHEDYVRQNVASGAIPF